MTAWITFGTELKCFLTVVPPAGSRFTSRPAVLLATAHFASFAMLNEGLHFCCINFIAANIM